MSIKHAFYVLPLLSILSLSPHELGKLDRGIASDIPTPVVKEEEVKPEVVKEEPKKEEEVKPEVAKEEPKKEEEVKPEVAKEESKKEEEKEKKHDDENCDHATHQAMSEQMKLLVTQQQTITAHLNQMQQTIAMQKMELEWKILMAPFNNLGAFQLQQQQQQLMYPSYNPYQYQQPMMGMQGQYPQQPPMMGGMQGYPQQYPQQYPQYQPSQQLMMGGFGGMTPQMDPRNQISPYQAQGFGIGNYGFNLGGAPSPHPQIQPQAQQFQPQAQNFSATTSYSFNL